MSKENTLKSKRYVPKPSPAKEDTEQVYNPIKMCKCRGLEEHSWNDFRCMMYQASPGSHNPPQLACKVFRNIPLLEDKSVVKGENVAFAVTREMEVLMGAFNRAMMSHPGDFFQVLEGQAMDLTCARWILDKINTAGYKLEEKPFDY